MISRFALARPRSLPEAFAAYAATGGDGAFVAGGTELLQVMKMGFAQFATLVDLKGLPELRGIAVEPDGRLRIGAATTNVEGIVRAIHRLDLHRVVVLAPYYPAHLVERFEAHLATNGIETIIVPPGEVPFGSHKEQAPEQTYRRAKRAFVANPADGLVLLGGGTPLQSILAPLETDLAVPVIANNQANLWNALTMASVREPIAGMGRLMTCF